MSPRASTPCPTPGCPHLQPCPAHPPKTHGWGTSTRKDRRTTSGWVEQRIHRRILRRDRWICHVCKKPGADEVDHVVPLGEGGPDTDANRAAIHAAPCHQLKTAEEARRARGGA